MSKIAHKIESVLGRLHDGGRIKTVLDAMTGRSDFEAAGSGALKWMSGPATGPTPPEYELTTIRNRIREQVRNNSLAAAGVETRAVNIVTNKLKPQSQVRADDPRFVPPRNRKSVITEDMAERFRVQIEAAWPIFARHVDPAGTLELEDLMYLVGRKTFGEDGESLTHRVMMPLENGRQFHTAFEPIEVDRLSTPPGSITDKNIRGGIKFNDNSAAVIYYVAKSNPSLGFGFSPEDYLPIPARDIRHLFRVKRPGQWRGVPDIAVTLQTLKDYKDLQDATILKAQHSAAHTAIYSTEDPEAVVDELKHPGSVEREGKSYDEITASPGEMTVVPNLDKFHEFQSNHPSATYESFIKGVKGDAAAGQMMSRLSLTREGEGVNYSSMRGLYLQDRMVFLFDRSLLVRRWLRWIWEAFVDEAVLFGWVDAPNYTARREDYLRVNWQFGAWGWVDPVKEVTAQILAVQHNIRSLTEVCQSEGGDAEETIRANIRLEKIESQEREKAQLPPKGSEPIEKPTVKTVQEIAEALADGERNGQARRF